MNALIERCFSKSMSWYLVLMISLITGVVSTRWSIYRKVLVQVGLSLSNMILTSFDYCEIASSPGIVLSKVSVFTKTYMIGF